MSRLNQFGLAVADLYRLYNQMRLQLFYRVFPRWILASLFGGVLTFFGLLLTIANLVVEKFSWVAASLGMVSLALGVTLLRYVIVLRSRR